MLGLITHEPNFFIIRESPNKQANKTCDFCGIKGHVESNCPYDQVQPVSNFSAKDISFCYVDLRRVREYLKIEVKP